MLQVHANCRLSLYCCHPSLLHWVKGHSAPAGALGSPGFISPEIIDGAEHDFSMDMYALGVILFVMLVGRKPFNVKDCEELTYIRIPISDAPGLKVWQSCSMPGMVLHCGHVVLLCRPLPLSAVRDRPACTCWAEVQASA